MSESAVVRFRDLTKVYGATTAVDGVSWDVTAGRVVGLLGRNGAGKTTMLRCLLGLTTPTSGSATLFGSSYSDLPHAARRVGVTMDGMGFLAGASGRTELRIWAKTLGVARSRVDEVLDLVDLNDVADRAVAGYSTGMARRLALAGALLPDPELLVLDEPGNGLDPDGIRWLRTMLRDLAGQGRTVLICSHLLTEIEQTVDDVVILQRTLRFAGTLDELTAGAQSLESRFFELAGDPRLKEPAC